MSKSTIYTEYSMLIIQKAQPYWSLAGLVLIFAFETVGQDCWKCPVIDIHVSNKTDRQLKEFAEVTNYIQNCTLCTHWNAIPGLILILYICLWLCKLDLFGAMIIIKIIFSDTTWSKSNSSWIICQTVATLILYGRCAVKRSSMLNYLQFKIELVSTVSNDILDFVCRTIS